MSKLDALIIDARGAIAKNARPSFSAGDYDDAIVELARIEKRDDETVAGALDRLTYTERDERVATLYAAARKAEGLVNSRPTPTQVEKQSDDQDAVLEHARKHARPGESVAAALTRLAKAGDAELGQIYAQAVTQ